MKQVFISFCTFNSFYIAYTAFFNDSALVEVQVLLKWFVFFYFNDYRYEVRTDWVNELRSIIVILFNYTYFVVLCFAIHNKVTEIIVFNVLTSFIILVFYI